jgi:hypothetical protein
VAVTISLAVAMGIGSGGSTGATSAVAESRPTERRPRDAVRGRDLLETVVSGILDEVLDGEHDRSGGDQPIPSRDAPSGRSDTSTRGS